MKNKKKTALFILKGLVAGFAILSLFITPALAQYNTNELRLEDSAGSEELVDKSINTRLEQGETETEPETTGIEHEDIGQKLRVVPGNEGEPQNTQSTQHNQTDLDFVQGRASVSVKAVEVRGWDAQKKEEFLEAVQAQAELQSEEDLENFATGILLQDENVESIIVDEKHVQLDYKMPAKLFGLFSSSLTAQATVETGSGEEIHPDDSGRIKVKYPWYHVFFRKQVAVSELVSRIRPEIDDEVLVAFEHGDSNEESDTPSESLSFNYEKISGRILEILSSVMKAAQGE